MIVAGLRRTSFIDYPGTLSAVVFVAGCNLRCGYCHNPDLVEGAVREPLDVDRVFSFLGARRGQLGGVVVTGGEPTLARGLRRFLRQVRALGFRVKLDTNGTRPEALQQLLREGLVDFVAMDLKDLPEDYPVLCRARVEPRAIYESIRTILSAQVEHEFRTTVVLPHHTPERLLRMAALLQGAQAWILQQYRPGRTLLPGLPFMPPAGWWLRAMAARLSSEVRCLSRESTADWRPPGRLGRGLPPTTHCSGKGFPGPVNNNPSLLV